MITMLFLSAALLVPNQAQAAPAEWTEKEGTAIEATRTLLAPWKKAWLAKDAKGFAQLFDYPAASPAWEAPKTAWREVEGIQEYRWKQSLPAPVQAKALTEEVSRYLQPFAVIEDVDFTIMTVSALNERAGAGLKVRFDLRGKLKDGTMRTDRGVLNLELARTAAGLRLQKIGHEAMETVTAKTAVFEEVTAKAGLAGVAVYPRTEAIRRGGYALASGDFDGDGLADLYVGSAGPGQLFRNKGDGTFTDVTEKAGLGKDTLVKAALFADMDNSGRTSLVLQRFVTDEKQELMFYRNQGGGKFAAGPATVERKRKHDKPMTLAAADFNGDGLLDLFVGYPGTRDFTDNQIDLTPGVFHQAVYLNRAGWRFEELTNAPGVSELFAEVVRPHSAIGNDFNGDGKTDIVVVDDRGDTTRLYVNLGNGRFSAIEDRARLNNHAWGMMAVGGDYASDGRDAIYFSNIDFSAGHRILRSIEESGLKDESSARNFTRLKGLLGGNRLYRPASFGSSFDETTAKAGVGWAGEAPGGAVWLDYNNDGLLDLYVTNGLWSADPDNDYASEFISKQFTEGEAGGKSETPNLVMKELQRTGQSFGGYQRNRLFRNDGDGAFTEVGYVTGADRLEDGYVAAAGDYDKSGHTDLILRNADPAGLKHSYSPITVLRNKGIDKNRSVSVYLKGNAGGSAAFGARVTVKVAGQLPQSREIRSVEGTVQSEQVAYFGIGKAEQIDDLEVRWPSGVIDRLTNVKPGRVLVHEGKGDLTYVKPPVGSSAN